MRNFQIFKQYRCRRFHFDDRNSNLVPAAFWFSVFFAQIHLPAHFLTFPLYRFVQSVREVFLLAADDLYLRTMSQDLRLSAVGNGSSKFHLYLQHQENACRLVCLFLSRLLTSFRCMSSHRFNLFRCHLYDGCQLSEKLFLLFLQKNQKKLRLNDYSDSQRISQNNIYQQRLLHFLL